MNGTMEIVQGSAWDMRTHVHVRWLWITLPLVLLIISLIFLAITVHKSTKEENFPGVWKTSAIAVLFNGLDDEAKQKVGVNCRMGDARAMARRLKVRLVPG
jgi:hypothetical protein